MISTSDMKHSSNLLILALGLVVCLMSCARKEDFPADERALTRGSAQTVPAKIGKLVTADQVPGILKSYLDRQLFPQTDRYALRVLSKGGMNLMYVVNLEGGGWVLVSGILFPMESPILGFSVTGWYDPDHIASPEASYWLETTLRKIAEEIAHNQ